MSASHRLTASMSFFLCLLGSALPAADLESIKPTIDRGVKALRTVRDQPQLKKHPVGAVALWGLTMLECDVPAADSAIQQAAAELRQASVELRHNYSLSLAILFFDRLGDPQDRYLIQSLAVRLLAGQVHGDGWSYESPAAGADEVRRLNTWLKQRNDKGKPLATGTVAALPPELHEQLKKLKQPPPGNWGAGDNSNTQVAVMALWNARRYQVPVADAMSRVSGRFRSTQNPDGGWSYLPPPAGRPGNPSTPSMTCAGLLVLAMSQVALAEAARRGELAGQAVPAEPARDPVFQTGMNYLAKTLPSLANRQKSLYFLWSLERVGVACNLPTIGDLDWYNWGASILRARQFPDGTWQSEEGSLVDTSFALLFLRRANLAGDLSASLKGLKDPGQATLKAVGIGGLKNDPPAASSLPIDLDPEAAKLARDLLQAAPARQLVLLEQLKDSKGVIHTDALAAVIPRLAGATQEKARDALAERLTRMSATTLRNKLAESDVEIRVAAIRAAATRQERSLVPDLIGLLQDPAPPVSNAAHAALKLISREDFGPPAGASPADRDRAIATWRAWWLKQGSR